MKSYLWIIVGVLLIGNRIQADNTPFWSHFIPAPVRQFIPKRTSSDPVKKPVESYGPAHYEGVNLPLLNAFGPTTLVKVKVDGKTVVQGPVDIRDSQLNGLEVNGPVSVLKTVIEGAVEINGPVTFHETTVKKEIMINGPLSADFRSSLNDISISTEEMIIKDSSVNNILVRKVDSPSHKKQVVYLEGNTVIKGDVTFEVPGGQVIVKGFARIDGKVTGGEVLKS